MDPLEVVRDKVLSMVRERESDDSRVVVTSAVTLTPRQAIGRPHRDDFPLFRGKEAMIQAQVGDGIGQAFTGRPGDFRGSLEEVLDRPLASAFDRALVTATANAFLRREGLIRGTIHCRDQGPRDCAGRLADYLRDRFRPSRVGVIGLQPALVEALVAADLEVRVTDLDPDNVGGERSGVSVEGAEAGADVTAWADVRLVTGTVLVNGTMESILSSRPTVFYGTSIAGAAALLGYERYCPCAG